MGQRTIRQTAKFGRELKKLRKHRGLAAKVQGTLNSLANDGIPDGDRLPGFGGLPVFKIRSGTGSIGERRGARIIYYKDDSELLALRIYLKNTEESIPNEDIMAMLKEYVL